MHRGEQFYIDGRWVDPIAPALIDVEDPSTEQPFARVAAGGKADIDRAVAAARGAFEAYSQTSREERLELLQRILSLYKKRTEDLAKALSREIGVPISVARGSQVPIGADHLAETIRVLETYEFEKPEGSFMVRREPIGVCGLITPWNWPFNQIMCKVAPALAAGCAIILKPSEISPFSALLFAEILDDAGVPAGVFNLVNGTGSSVGASLAAHPGVDMISFTGSTRAGILVSQAAATTVKRVTLELGGKSPNVLLRDADFSVAVPAGVRQCYSNNGQSCSTPTRMIVPVERLPEVEALARHAAESFIVGDPGSEDTQLGTLASGAQFTKVQSLIEAGIEEGAKLVTGGPGRPAHLSTGFYARPTVFSEVTSDMRIAREEIFGPVLCILAYGDEEEAISVANDTVYGLGSRIHSRDVARARAAAARIRAGQVYINNAAWSASAAFGGYKQSGNGREYGARGFEEYLETKTILGYFAE